MSLSNWWRRKRDERILRHRPIPDELWLDTLRAHPFLRHRSMSDLTQLRELSTLFLARKEFTAVQGLTLTDEMAVAVAAQACVPILRLGLDCYDGFTGIVLQPGEVLARREWQDKDGIVHSGDEVLAGEAMPGGPVMLSWQDVRDAGRHAADGYNVVIHEFAHVLDMLDGREADGMPPLPDRQAQQRWSQAMSAALQRLQQTCETSPDSDDAMLWLDPYAASGPEEFFAVCAEVFFVAPLNLVTHEPGVYAVLGEYFQQDPVRHAPATPQL